MRIILSFSFVLSLVLCTIITKSLIASPLDPIELKKEHLLLKKQQNAVSKNDSEKNEDSEKKHDVVATDAISEQAAASVSSLPVGTIVVSDGIMQSYSNK